MVSTAAAKGSGKIFKYVDDGMDMDMDNDDGDEDLCGGFEKWGELEGRR